MLKDNSGKNGHQQATRLPSGLGFEISVVNDLKPQQRAQYPLTRQLMLDATTAHLAAARSGLPHSEATLYLTRETVIRVKRGPHAQHTPEVTKFMAESFPSVPAPEIHLDHIIMRMGLPETPRTSVTAALADISRILKEDGSAVIWAAISNHTRQSFFHAVLRERDRLATDRPQISGHHVFTVEELAENTKRLGLRSAGSVGVIDFRFSSQGRLGPELNGDCSILTKWNDRIRNLSVLGQPQLSLIGYHDSGNDIQFDISFDLFVARRGQ